MLLIDATTAEHTRGIGTVIHGVVGGLAYLDPDTVVVTAGPKLEVQPNVPVRRVRIARTRPGRLLYQRLLLPYDTRRIETRDDPIDRVLLLDSYAPLAGMRDETRYAALVHDTLPLSHPEFWSPAKRLVKRTAFWSLRRKATTLFTSTEFNADELRRLTGRTSRVVRFGCGQLTDEEADAALAEPLPARGRYLLYIGAFEPRKSVLTLLDVFERLTDHDDSELRLVLAGSGSGSYRALIRERVARLPPEAVTTLENPGRDESIRLIAGAGALLLPSRAEGFGLPILEALALGTPVVASDLEAIRTWAGDAIRYARRDRPGDWVEPILAALAASDGDRQKGQRFARGFRWRACAEQLTSF